MSTALIDPELLAAVLDGTATSEERAAVMHQIAGSRTAHAQFVEAAAIHRELTGAAPMPGEHTPSPVPGAIGPAAVSTSRWWRVAAPLALAAAALVIVFVQRSPAPAGDFLVAVAPASRVVGATGSGSLERVLGPGWDEPGWTVTRGVGAQRATSSRAFRSGVRMAQFDAAARAADTAAAQAAVAQLRDLIADVSGSAPVASQLETLSQQLSPSDSAAHVALASQLRSLLGAADWYDLGFWTGASHVAALSGRAVEFTRDARLMSALEALRNRAGEPTEAWRGTISLLDGIQPTGVANEVHLRDVVPVLRRVMQSAGG